MLHTCEQNRLFFQTQCFEKEAFVLAENFRPIYIVIGGKPSKMVRNRRGRPMGPYPFRLFLSSDSTYEQNIN